MKKEKCLGCESNFYNSINPYGVKECCHFKTAKIVFRQKININQRAPFKQKAIRVPDCYHERGYVFWEKK